MLHKINSISALIRYLQGIFHKHEAQVFDISIYLWTENLSII